MFTAATPSHEPIVIDLPPEKPVIRLLHSLSMSQESGTPKSEIRQAPKLKPFLTSLPHHERRFLQALALIIESGKAQTVDDLIKYCRQAREAAAIDFIKGLADQGMPVDLVFDAMCVHFRIVAHKRNSGLLNLCAGKKVGLLLPLPPHILDTFLPMNDVTVLLPDGHHLPPNLERFSGRVHQGTRACRAVAGEIEVFVCDAFREKEEYFTPATASDVMDLRILKPGTIFILHLRPHRDPDDIPAPLPKESMHIL
jgi:hypothetical protein